MSSLRFLALTLLLGVTVVIGPRNAASVPAASKTHSLDPAAFRIIPSESGDVDYYRRMKGSEPFIRAEYRPPWETAILGYRIPDAQRRSVAELKWKWRARQLPKGGNECIAGKGDSAAVIYVTWKRALKWYSIKYVWSAGAPKGKTCREKRGLFRAQDTVIVESGGPLGEWRTHRVNVDQEFRQHFEDGDPKADVPDLVGIGILTDGDQTQSESAADYGDFVVTLK